MLGRAGYLALEDLDGGAILLRFDHVDHLHCVHLRLGLGVQHNSRIISLIFFFFLVTGPGMSLSLQLSETGVCWPQIRARLKNNLELFIYEGLGVGVGDWGSRVRVRVRLRI